jgi:alpha-N-arabinofuranosidase
MEGSIQVDATEVTGQVPRYLFGQFIEHEHNTIDDGLLAELLHDRKFEEGDRDGNGVSARWVPEERVADRYWELRDGWGVHDRYFIDHNVYYGGGASQAIEILRGGSNRASVYQIGLQFAKGRAYSFYVYMRKHGTGKGFVEIDKLGGPNYLHKDFDLASDAWEKLTAAFTAPEDTSQGRVRIGFEGLGTFWMDSASIMPADNVDGMRRDVIEALRPLHVSVLRYPGGCYADYYNWKNGVGLRDKRPEKWSTIWHEWNSNDFGTDEYMELARILGYDGHLTANYTSGTARDSAEWVEYANGSADTPMGGWRAQNGHPEPYGIKLWAIGNEAPNLCSEEYTGGTKLADYATRFREYQEAMRKVDPSIQFMASSVGNPDWIRDLLQAVPAERLAISIYTGRYGAVDTICDPKSFYQAVVAEPLEFRDKLDANIAAPGSRLPSHPFFAITEFNSWWLPETHDPDFRLANALYFAGVFNELLRHAKRIFLAENCSLINVQGIIEVNPVAIKLTPPYFAYLLYTNHIGSEVLKTETSVPSVLFGTKPPALDAIATRGPDGRTLFLAVVNRAENEAVSAQINLKGWQLAGAQAQVYELAGRSWDAFNPYGSADNVNIAHRTVEVTQTPFSYLFPAHTVTVLEISGSSLSTQKHSEAPFFGADESPQFQ